MQTGAIISLFKLDQSLLMHLETNTGDQQIAIRLYGDCLDCRLMTILFIDHSQQWAAPSGENVLQNTKKCY